MGAHKDTQSSGSDRTRVLDRLETVQNESEVRVTELEGIAKRRGELLAELRSLAEESCNLRSRLATNLRNWQANNPGKRFDGGECESRWDRWFETEQDLVKRLARLQE